MKLVPEDAPILREKIAEFRGDPGCLKGSAQLMLRLMYQHKALGLAAPQVGLRTRMFVIQPTMLAKPIVAINPVLVQRMGPPVEGPEACLSFPGRVVPVVRSENILVQYTDTRGRVARQQLLGIWARAFQHELDHLDGVCLVGPPAAETEEARITRLKLEAMVPTGAGPVGGGAAAGGNYPDPPAPPVNTTGTVCDPPPVAPAPTS